MKNNEKIIVSLTSWKKRIDKVESVINEMLNQTLQADKIILNLSTDEFPLMEEELPIKLVNLSKSKNDVFEIYWVKENTKPYKKLIPTLKRFPNDIIITIDDDIKYPENFIEIMYDEYISWNRQCPITSGDYKWGNNIFTHYGGYSLVKGEFFGNYIYDLYENVYLKQKDDLPFSDLLFTYASLLNGRRYKFTNKLNMNTIRKKIGNDSVSISKLGTKDYAKKIDTEHKILRKYILEKYNKTYDELFNSKIHVNLTTWKKRDMCVPEMLKNFKNQTLKADRIILWLSRDEYDENNIPKHLKQCLDDNLLTDIMWVDKNIYCHKRHECFKIFNDVYNVFIDDDILYEKNFLEEIITNSKKYQNSVTCTAGKIQTYERTNRIMSTFKKGTKPSINNQFLGCWMCFPPYSFPIESYNLSELRDKFIPKCDEGWLVAWFIKKGITVNLIHDFGEYKQKNIGTSQKDALYNENKKINNGVRVKERMFSNALICVNVVNEAKKIWPKFYIEKCCDKELLELYNNNELYNNINEKYIIEEKEITAVDNNEEHKTENIINEITTIENKEEKNNLNNKKHPSIININIKNRLINHHNKAINSINQDTKISKKIEYANSVSEKLKEKIENKKNERKRKEELDKLNHGIDLTYFF